MMKQRIFALALALMMFLSIGAVSAEGITLADVNAFLNDTSKLGEGGKANPVAVIPMNHLDGPLEDDMFYAFVPFKYVARNYIKYQVSFISCTCRSADVNLWSTAYLELTLPESGLIKDAKVRCFSFDKDGTEHYLGGFWGDSSPVPGGEQTYEMYKEQFIPYFIDKSYEELKDISTIADIALEAYQDGEGRGEYTLDTWSGATVSANNIVRILHAMFKFHATDYFFDNDPEAVALREVFTGAAPEAEKVDVKTANIAATEALPAPVDTEKVHKDKESGKETPCEAKNFSLSCSSIDSENLLQYLNRPDVLYIDVRDHGDYMKKHLRNFEVIPFFGLIFNAEAHTDATKPHLYGGTPSEPIPVYKESDEILAALFPKNATIFLMCQSGGRVAMLMQLLAARGWDMSKIYNVGGMAQYTGPKYRPLVNDAAELLMDVTYKTEGLTRIAPAK